MTEANFIALAKKRYAELQSLNKINNFYDYEKEFESLWRDLTPANWIVTKGAM